MKKFIIAMVALCLVVCTAISLAGCSILVGGTVLKYESYSTEGEISASESKAIYDFVEKELKDWYLNFDMNGDFKLTAKGKELSSGKWEQVGDNVTVTFTNGAVMKLQGNGLIMSWRTDFSNFDPDVNVFVTFNFKLPKNH